jgi:hypothetical protein
MIILLVLAAAVVGLPIAATVLVSLASRREDARHSLTGKAPNWVTWAARRLLNVPPPRPGRRQVSPVPGPRPPADEDEDISASLTARPV